MRIRVTHTTTFSYEAPARSILQVLRLTPRSHEGQHVVSWRVEADSDVQLKAGEDPFGNLIHTLSTDRPVTSLALTVSGEVRTYDTGGVVSRTTERLPPGVYLRDTALTHADEALRRLAETVAAEAGDDPLARLHTLLRLLVEEVEYDTAATAVTATAAEAFAMRRGVCEDLSHIFVCTARRLGAPARYVSGHLVREDGMIDQQAAHAWAEAHVPGLGWVGFDPANGISPTEAYVRVAVGLDYQDAAPIRGARTGGGQETMAVTLRVTEARQQ